MAEHPPTSSADGRSGPENLRVCPDEGYASALQDNPSAALASLIPNPEFLNDSLRGLTSRFCCIAEFAPSRSYSSVPLSVRYPSATGIAILLSRDEMFDVCGYTSYTRTYALDQIRIVSAYFSGSLVDAYGVRFVTRLRLLYYNFLTEVCSNLS